MARIWRKSDINIELRRTKLANKIPWSGTKNKKETAVLRQVIIV